MPSPTQATKSFDEFASWVYGLPTNPQADHIKILTGQLNHACRLYSPEPASHAASTNSTTGTRTTARRRGRPARARAQTGEPVTATKSGVTAADLAATIAGSPGITVAELRNRFSGLRVNIIGRMLKSAAKSTGARPAPLIAASGDTSDATTQLYPAAGSTQQQAAD